MAQIGLAVSIPALTGFIYFGDQGIGLLMIFGLLAGLSLSSVDTGARWPLAQAVLRPELRATGRAAIDMAIGAMGALGVWISGRLVDSFDGNITPMLLLMIPIPKIISTLLWIPMFKTFPEDRANLHDVLAKRRVELTQTQDKEGRG
jgi:hypothetical protein